MVSPPIGETDVSFHAAVADDEAVPCLTVSTDAATRPTTPDPNTVAIWAARLVWVVVALTGALAVDGALASADTLARVVVPVVWWAVVGGVVVALVVPAPAGLTATRLVVPLVIALAIGCLAAGTTTAWSTTFLVASLGAVGVVCAPEFAGAMVQGSAYGNERRFPLRAPANVLLPMLVTWLAWAGCTIAAIITLTRSAVAVGAVLAAVSVAGGVVLSPRFHRLSRRWLVLVPAGVVVHDPLVLGETLMATRADVRRVGLAAADSEAADLSGPAAGHLVEVVLRDMALAVFPATAEHPQGRAIHVQSYLVAPSRPGAALRAMAEARFPVG